MDEKVFYILALILGAINLITFLLYGVDKILAINSARRIPEKTLLGISITCGGVGGLLAMLIFRHKTRGEHWYFRVVNLIGIALCCLAIYFVGRVTVF